MDLRELGVADAYAVTPRCHADDRGVFLEWYRPDRLAEVTGRTLALGQANVSVSGRGVVRGLHYADVPPGQAKFVSCLAGAVLDVVVDLRVGSPTFGAVDTVLLDALDRRSVFVPEGVGHGFCALEDGSTVAYLCSEPYAPGREHGVDPFDADLRVPWPTGLELVVSEKDRQAPSLEQALAAGALPDYEDCRRLYSQVSCASATG